MNHDDDLNRRVRVQVGYQESISGLVRTVTDVDARGQTTVNGITGPSVILEYDFESIAIGFRGTRKETFVYSGHSPDGSLYRKSEMQLEGPITGITIRSNGYGWADEPFQDSD